MPQDSKINSSKTAIQNLEEKPQNTIHSATPSAQQSLADLKGAPKNNRYFLGLVSLALVVFLWVSSSFVMSLLLRIYPKAFFSTYMSTATFQLYFPILYLNSLFKKKPREAEESSAIPKSPSSLAAPASKKLTKREMLEHSVLFFSIYFISCYLANLSFEYTDVVSAALLLSTSCFFTLIFSIIAGVEKFSLMKGLSVLICAGGLCIVGGLSYFYDEKTTQTNPPINIALGNIFAVGSASLYGLYSVILKKKTIDESRINMPFFFGCVGLLSTILLWPIFFILHITKLEVLEVPTLFSLVLLFANNIFGGLAANYFWIYALLHTSPLIVSIGLAFSIPMTILFDLLINGNSIFQFRYLAGVCIALGFIILNLTAIYPDFDFFFERSCLFVRNKK